MAKQQPSLDARIASALAANGDADRSTLVALIDEATKAIATAEETLKVNSALALDIENPNPSEADDKARTAELTIKRLNIALPRLTERVANLDRAAALAKWNADIDAAQAEADKIYEELTEIYSTEFLQKIIKLYSRYLDNEHTIARLRARAPSMDETLKADEFSHARPHPSFWDDIRLPAFREGEYILPLGKPALPWSSQVALAASEHIKNTWHLAGSAPRPTEEQIAAKNAANEAEQLAASKASLERYYQAQREAELRKLGLDPVTGAPKETA